MMLAPRTCMLRDFLMDARHLFRSWRRNPLAALVLLCILSLGIAANTAIFGVVQSILLRPIPYPDSDRLCLIWETNPGQGVKREGPSGSNYSDWREQNRSFEDLAAIEVGTATITGQGEPEQIPGLRVTPNLFSVLQAKAILGRLFSDQEASGGRRPYVILSYGFWQRRFAGDPAILGKTVMADGLPYEVIGVLSRDFFMPVPSDVFVPYPFDELKTRARMDHDLGVIGRLKRGVSPQQANAEIDGIARRIQAQHPEVTGWLATVVPMQKALTESVRTSLLVLFAAVGFVLLLVCANVANLMLARSVARRREIAVREALGATRTRLWRQLLAESIVTATVAGLIGLLFAVWAIQGLQAMLPSVTTIPDAAAEVVVPDLRIDWVVLSFTLAVSFVAGILFGLAPAIAALRGDTAEQLKQGAKGSVGGTRKMRYGLLAAELALAQILLAGAGLTLRSFFALQQTSPGFQASRLLTMEMELPTDSRYKNSFEQADVYQRFLNAVRAIPGVESAGLTSVLPLGHEDERARFLIENAPPLSPGERLSADARRITPGFLETMKIPLIAGRSFNERDNRDGVRVAIVDSAFAKRFFPDGNPIGRRVLFRNPYEIVGVVGSVKHEAMARPPAPTIYMPMQQAPTPRMTLSIRTARDPVPMVKDVKQAIWSVDRDQPVFRVRTMEKIIDASNSQARTLMFVLGGFAGIAVLLAALGVFGIVAYNVTQRTREIGIRIALGARATDVFSMVLRESMFVTAIGVGTGISGAILAGRVLANQLYGVKPFEPLLLLVLACGLGAVSMLASYLPARRAAKVDPMIALREE